MIFENLFSVAGLVAMLGWLLLLASPLIPVWSDRMAGVILPLILSLVYVGLLIFPSSGSGGGFGTLAEVMELFSYEQAALAAWVHFLAFDLFIGAWVCRTARAENISFWLVAPCLPLTFLFGPAGLLAFSVARTVAKPKVA
jgi:hypothetical protein